MNNPIIANRKKELDKENYKIIDEKGNKVASYRLKSTAIMEKPKIEKIIGKKLSIIPLLILLMIIPLATIGSCSLGTFKQNECVNLVVPLNTSSVTLTNVNSPSPNSTILLTNQVMTKSGNFFNYTFCNTSIMGTYTYGYCDDSTNCYSNDFKINGSGQDVTGSQVTLIIIGLVVLLVMASFFFICSLLFKHPGTKIFLMALCSITLIIMIGIFASSASTYLAEFNNMSNIYNNYYTVMIIFAGVAMAGILVWLVYYSVKLFHKSKGRIEDD